MKRILGVFAKWPTAGTVKTRLAALRGDGWAARVAEAFLRDTLKRLALVSARRIIAYAPADAKAKFAALAGDAFELVPQCAGDLGMRLADFFATQGEAVVVGADSPTLLVEYVERAFEALREFEVVLGPATDGGYYLLGCRAAPPPIFTGIAWGTSTVLTETVAALGDAGQLSVLPPWYDVDTPDDWNVLCGHVAAMRRAGVDPGIPHTEALMSASTGHG